MNNPIIGLDLMSYQSEDKFKRVRVKQWLLNAKIKRNRDNLKKKIKYDSKMFLVCLFVQAFKKLVLKNNRHWLKCMTCNKIINKIYGRRRIKRE